MKTASHTIAGLTLLALTTLVGSQTFAAEKKPLKVFILAGQSNMEGHAKVETFDYIGDDPATAPLLRMMRGADGKPAVCEGAWISYFTCGGDKNGEGFGKLTAGYGSRQKPEQDGGKIGPEFTFGLNADKDTVEFRKAMAAPASLPEFKANVIAVPTAPFWSEELGAIDKKREKVSQMRYFLDSKHKDHANADGKMTDEQKREHVQKFEAELISPAEAALWKRGASNAGYHYLGCAKTFALMGKAFAEATLQMMKTRQ